MTQMSGYMRCFLALALSLLTGCAQKSGKQGDSPSTASNGPAAAPGNPNATSANFEKIEWELPLGEIEKILGKGEKISREQVFEELGVEFGSGSLRAKVPNPYSMALQGVWLRWKGSNQAILVLFAEFEPNSETKNYGSLLMTKEPNEWRIDWQRGTKKGTTTRSPNPIRFR